MATKLKAVSVPMLSPYPKTNRIDQSRDDSRNRADDDRVAYRCTSVSIYSLKNAQLQVALFSQWHATGNPRSGQKLWVSPALINRPLAVNQVADVGMHGQFRADLVVDGHVSNHPRCLRSVSRPCVKKHGIVLRKSVVDT